MSYIVGLLKNGNGKSHMIQKNRFIVLIANILSNGNLTIIDAERKAGA
jgi:hypothetical protein